MLLGLDKRCQPERGAEGMDADHTYGATTALQPQETSLCHQQMPPAHVAPKGAGGETGAWLASLPQLLCPRSRQQARFTPHFHPRGTVHHLRWGWSIT